MSNAFSRVTQQTFYLRLFLVVILYPAAFRSIGQSGTFKFQHLTIDNGLSQNLVYSIAQDVQGFMWFGTKDGLNRYDGYDFTAFHHNPFDTTSLSDNTVTTLFVDSKGQLWIGTAEGGLDLYDQSKNRFIHFLMNEEDPDKVSGDNVSAITEDHRGNLWIGTEDNGLFRFTITNNGNSLSKKITHYVHHSNDSTSLGYNSVTSVYVDHFGKLWVANSKSGVQIADVSQNIVQFRKPSFSIVKPAATIKPNGIQFDMSHCQYGTDSVLTIGALSFFEDSQNRLWMGAVNGLLLVDLKSKTLTHFDPAIPNIAQGTVLSVCESSSNGQQSDNRLWIGLYSGLGSFNTVSFTLDFIENEQSDKESLQPGRILKIYKDRSGCMWLGSNGYGLSKFDYHSTLFNQPQYHAADNKIKTENLSVRSFFDTKDFLLIGAINGFWKADKTNGMLSKVDFRGISGEDAGLIYEIIPAGAGAVWMACDLGLAWYDPIHQKGKGFFTQIKVDGQSDNRIYRMLKEGNNIWVLTGYSFGEFNIDQGTFKHYFFSKKVVNGFGEPSYGDILKDKEGNFWIGTIDGLLFFDRSKQTFTHYVNNPEDSSSLSFNAVRCIIADPKLPNRYLWVATAGGGLNKFDVRSKKFIHFTDKDGLPNNVVYGILPDNQGNLWMSTNKGISEFNPVTGKFHNYDVSVGLQSNEFNSSAYYKSDRGELFFGGVKGFNAFFPDDIQSSSHKPPVVLTDFRLFNRSISAGDMDSPLQNPISVTKRLSLPYEDNAISFQVAALDYSNPQKNIYAYRLDPFNSDWIMLGTNRLITFSNLDPGRYTLHVKAANSDGVWNNAGTSMELVITPPWYRTNLAYAVYGILLIFFVYLIRRYYLSKMRLESNLALEHLETQKLRELDHLKSRFFANISHELRTPLTLIMGPLDDISEDHNVHKLERVLPAMQRNARRLLTLINQLLDISKLDAGNYAINTDRNDIVNFLTQIAHTFSSLAERKNISLTLCINTGLKEALENETISFYFDNDALEKILYNLLGNAFKFTPDGGEITVGLDYSTVEDDFLELKVEDTGSGMAKENLPHIFNRFYQVDDSSIRRYDGSGIGLTLVKELVELHAGKIYVRSESGKGTAFSCHFPLNKKIQHGNELVNEQTKVTEGKTTGFLKERVNNTNGKVIKDKILPVIHIIEDHDDVRQYIVEKLKDHYNILESINGKEGFGLATRQMPDLIISDVMMPEMNGFELCRKLKTDIRTSHIPVILLTARADDTDKITGLQTGADAYLIKPFNARELLTRIDKLIELRATLRAKFSGKIAVKPAEITVTSRDRLFIEQLLAVTEKHIDDNTFSVVRLGEEVNMSTSQINRKLKAITDQSAQQFIQTVRMQRALQLLRQDGATVSEIAFKVGFEDPGYFTKVFKSHFDCLPSEKGAFPVL